MTFYALGQWIVKEQGEKRAKYGHYIIKKLSAALTEKYGRGFSEDTLAFLGIRHRLFCRGHIILF